MPQLKPLQSIDDYNRISEITITELKAFLALEGKNSHKFTNRNMGKFLCPVIDFYHPNERADWMKRLSLFNFPVIKDERTTFIIFDDVNNLTPVTNLKTEVPGKKPEKDAVGLIFLEIKKFLQGRNLSNRICQGPDFIRVQTTQMAGTVTTFLSTHLNLKQFKFERHGEDIFIRLSSVITPTNGQAHGSPSANDDLQNQPDPNEDYLRKVITEAFGIMIHTSGYSETHELIIGFESKEIAERAGLLCVEYGLDCTQNNQTLIFKRTQDYPFTFEDIKSCYKKISTETTGSSQPTQEDVSKGTFYKQVRDFIRKIGDETDGLNEKVPYVYRVGISGDRDALITKARELKPEWLVEKSRDDSKWLKFSLIGKVSTAPVIVIEKKIKAEKTEEQVIDKKEQLVTIATQMPLLSVLSQIPDNHLITAFENRGLITLISNDVITDEFTKRNLKKPTSDDEILIEFKKRGLKLEISDALLTEIVKERGPVFAGSLMQALLLSK